MVIAIITIIVIVVLIAVIMGSKEDRDKK